MILGPGEFRVIFCDSIDIDARARRTAVGELDTGFSLSKAGATVELYQCTVVPARRFDAHVPDLEFGHLVRPG